MASGLTRKQMSTLATGYDSFGAMERLPANKDVQLSYPRRQSTGLTCPRCGSDVYVYRSRVRTFWEWLQTALFKKEAFRCDPCGYRYLGPRVEGGDYPPKGPAH